MPTLAATSATATSSSGEADVAQMGKYEESEDWHADDVRDCFDRSTVGKPPADRFAEGDERVHRNADEPSGDVEPVAVLCALGQNAEVFPGLVPEVAGEGPQVASEGAERLPDEPSKCDPSITIGGVGIDQQNQQRDHEDREEEAEAYGATLADECSHDELLFRGNIRTGKYSKKQMFCQCKKKQNTASISGIYALEHKAHGGFCLSDFRFGFHGSARAPVGENADQFVLVCEIVIHLLLDRCQEGD